MTNNSSYKIPAMDVAAAASERCMKTLPCQKTVSIKGESNGS
jgi:hypothetical protein